VGMFACFAKVLAKLFLVYVLYDMISYRALRMAGMTVDVSWLYFTLLTLFRGHQLVKLRSSLGIVLGGMIVSSGSSELSDELKQALLVLDDGDVDGAVYRFQQISLDADESHKAIALYWLGECYVRQNKLDEARDAFLEALEADPTLMQPKEALQHLEDPKSQ
jgi:tetratricopeptide (TPR) repeat protein